MGEPFEHLVTIGRGMLSAPTGGCNRNAGSNQANGLAEMIRAGSSEPPAAKGLEAFGNPFVLAAGSLTFDRKPTIPLRALAEPRIPCDRTQLLGPDMSIACGASKKVDIT